MGYTIKELADLAGVSTRTLRYYDEIGILKPAIINSSGYRIYGKSEVDQLQQILFYRELGVELNNIKKMILSPDFDEINQLRLHHEKLLEKRQQLDTLIANVHKTIFSKERKIEMSDKERFEGFKKKLIDENNEKFGKEVVEKYGEGAVNKSNESFMKMTEEQYNELTSTESSLFKTLKEAYLTKNPAGDLGQESAKLHAKWITLCWGNYNKEAHANLTQMYVDDDRFKAYYDREQPGTAEFLRDAVWIYTGMKSK